MRTTFAGRRQRLRRKDVASYGETSESYTAVLQTGPDKNTAADTKGTYAPGWHISCDVQLINI